MLCLNQLQRSSNEAAQLITFYTTVGHTYRVQKGTSRQRSGKEIPTPKTEVGKKQTNNQVLYYETYRKPNEQLFSQ